MFSSKSLGSIFSAFVQSIFMLQIMALSLTFMFVTDTIVPVGTIVSVTKCG